MITNLPQREDFNRSIMHYSFTLLVGIILFLYLSFFSFLQRYILLATVPIVFVILICLCQHYIWRFQHLRLAFKCPSIATEVELRHSPDEAFTFETTDTCTQQRTAMRTECYSSFDIDPIQDAHLLVNPAEDPLITLWRTAANPPWILLDLTICACVKLHSKTEQAVTYINNEWLQISSLIFAIHNSGSSIYIRLLINTILFAVSSSDQHIIVQYRL